MHTAQLSYILILQYQYFAKVERISDLGFLLDVS
jgi:hypothetical protein